MNSKAYFLIKYGTANNAFELRDFEIADPLDNEVQIEVCHFGLNYADVMARNGQYKAAPTPPSILGYEITGKIVKTGKLVDKTLLNKRVLAFTRFGGYAQHVNTNQDAIVLVNDEPAEELLCIATQYVTAYYMTNILAPIQQNEQILIHAAAGGLGLALIEFAKLKNAFIIGVVGNEEKRKFLEYIGVDLVINRNKEDYFSVLKNSKHKITSIFNPIGGKSFKKDMNLLNTNGKLYLYGGSSLLEKKKNIFNTLSFLWNMGLTIPIGLMMQSKSIVGVNMLKIADENPQILKKCMTDVYNLYKTDKIKILKTNMFKHDELAMAHNLLESGKSSGKIAIAW